MYDLLREKKLSSDVESPRTSPKLERAGKEGKFLPNMETDKLGGSGYPVCALLRSTKYVADLYFLSTARGLEGFGLDRVFKQNDVLLTDPRCVWQCFLSATSR